MNPDPRSEIAPFSVSQHGGIDDIRTAFEAAYASGQRHSIESFLDGVSDAERPDAVRKLLRLALEYDQKVGETPSRDNYVARFPDNGELVHQLFDEIESRPAGDKLRPIDRSTPRDGDVRVQADRNLLFGILALQNNFIDRHGLIAAFDRWTTDKRKTLGAILVDLGKLGAEHRQLLDGLVIAHLKFHGDDPRQSLAAVSSASSARRDLESISDADLADSLASLDVPAASQNRGLPSTVSWSAPTDAGPHARFRILRLHAHGGLGDVFVAEDQELHREVALKQIQERRAHEPVSRARFVNEAEITGGLEHPGIVPIYGLGQYADGRPFYAMRFIRGDNLHEAIRGFHAPGDAGVDPGRRTLELRRLLRRFVDVCNAVEYAHSRGVLHRDLKPANVMLGKYGETLLVDWGLAKPIGRSNTMGDASEATLCPTSTFDLPATETGSALGTPEFMSPEQAAGRLDLLGRASDVYSLGATLHCLLTGHAPFRRQDGEPPAALLKRVERGEFPAPRQLDRSVPRALEAICLRSMARAHDRRYPSARALADDVERWLADEPVAAYRERRSERLARWGRRHKPLLAGGVALLATAVVALSATTVMIDRERQRTEHRRLEAVAAEGRAREAQSLAEARRREAETQRNRALEAERQVRDEVARGYALTARIAAQRSNWRPALEYYDKALAADPDDRLDLEVERLRVLHALGEKRLAKESLEALASRDDLRQHAATVLLSRGEMKLFEWGDQRQALSLIRQALERQTLSPADEAYARGLLSDSTPQALANFERAVTLDPFHQRARAMQGLLLLLLGRLNEARQELRVARLLFPEDELFVVLTAFVDVFEGRRDEALATLRGLRGKVSDRTLEAALALTEVIGDVFKQMNDFDWKGTPGETLVWYWRIAAVIARYADVFGTGNAANFFVPNHPLLGHYAAWVKAIVPKMVFGQYEALAEETSQLAERNPEGLVLGLCGKYQLLAADEALARGDESKAKREAAAASRYFERAASAGSLAPWATKLAGAAWVRADLVQLQLLAKESEEYTSLTRRAKENVRCFAAQPNLGATLTRAYSRFAAVLGEDDVARPLLKAWRSREPGNLEPARIAAEMELQAGHFDRAIAEARSVLAIEAADEAMKTVLAKSAEACRRRLAELEPLAPSQRE